MKRGNPWLWFAAVLVYAFLYIPLIIVVLYSFNDSRLNAEWVGFTLFWYKALFNNTEMLLAARNSLIIALCASFCATLQRSRQPALLILILLFLVSSLSAFTRSLA